MMLAFMQTAPAPSASPKPTKSVRIASANAALLSAIHLRLVTDTGNPNLKEADALRLIVTEGLRVVAAGFGMPAPVDDAADLRTTKKRGGPKKARPRAEKAS